MENKVVQIEQQVKSPKAIVEYYIHVGEEKAVIPFAKLVLLAVMAGACIALGASSAAVASHSIENAGVAKLVAGSVFPVGLMMIILFGLELFTSGTLMIMGAADKKYSWLKVVKTLVIIYVSNMIGAVLIALMLNTAGQFDFNSAHLGAYTIKVAVGKVHLDFFTAFISGILCNILVCGAVLLAATAKDVVGKLFAIFFPILAFIIGGFEHCVANMYYIPAGIIASKNPEYATLVEEIYGYGAEALADLTWSHFFIHNLIPVTLGNIIGGGVCIGLALYYAFVKDAKK
ncbi:MAG: formate/nitrite transporter family protein [Eubacteriales bacterium]